MPLASIIQYMNRIISEVSERFHAMPWAIRQHVVHEACAEALFEVHRPAEVTVEARFEVLRARAIAASTDFEVHRPVALSLDSGFEVHREVFLEKRLWTVTRQELDEEEELVAILLSA